MIPIASVGVDLGGTWIRLAALNDQARTIKSFKAAAPALRNVPSLLKKIFTRWKARPDRLFVASRGVWLSAERQAFKKALQGLSPHVEVMSDVEGAWLAAFRRNQSGIVVIAGTGSIAYGRDARGRSKRAGGLGPPLGDEGSAFWIGKLWLQKRVGRSHQAVRRVAALAPRVLAQARSGNPIALRIVHDAQDQLAALALKIARDLELKGSILISWGGSLLGNTAFRSGFQKSLRRMAPARLRFNLRSPRSAVAEAVAGLAFHA